jgi:hypothetical protein
MTQGRPFPRPPALLAPLSGIWKNAGLRASSGIALRIVIRSER